MKTTKSSHLRLRLLAGLLGAMAVTQWSGCVAAAVGAAGAAGAGAVAYVRGDLEATLEGKHENVVAAGNRALADLQLVKVTEHTDALSSIIVARTAQDRKITLTFAKTSESLTKVKIRVGLFGDQPMSISILDKIKANL